MKKDEFRYKPLHQEELLKIWNKHKTIIEKFIFNNQYDSNKIFVNENIVMSVIAKVDQRRKYFKYYHGLDMSEYKEVALICFWYVKLKPIYLDVNRMTDREIKEYDSINEKLAVYYLLSTFRNMLNKNNMSTTPLDKLPKKYINELVYSLTYRDISKEALILLVESIAIFLGLSPYSNKEEKRLK